MRSYYLMLLSFTSMSLLAQSICPAVNFLSARTINLKPSPTSHIDVVRQSDGSYTGYEVTDAPPYRLIRTTPHFEKQFGACLPHSLPASPATASPVENPLGAGSQPQVSEMLSNGNLLVASTLPGTARGPIRLDIYGPQHNLISEDSVEPNNQENSFSDFFAALTLADMNGDGIPDLIALELETGGLAIPPTAAVISIFSGNGDGTFQPGKSEEVGSAISLSAPSFAVGDINGDGKLDLAVGWNSISNGAVTVVPGNGDGTLAKPLASSLSYQSFPGSLALADLNGDGRLDLVVATGVFQDRSLNAFYSSSVAVAVGNGDGSFQGSSFFPVLAFPSTRATAQVAVGDLNGDGDPDIVTAQGTILFGDGRGGFPSRADYATSASGPVTLGDFDGDGNVDIIMGSGNPTALLGDQNSSATVLFGEGNGAFTAAPVSFAAVGDASAIGQSIITADFNRDGIPDLALENGIGEFAAILVGKGDGTFSQSFRVDFLPSGSAPKSIATADFDGDGSPDLAVLLGAPAPNTQGEVQVFHGNGDGTLSSPLSLPITLALNPQFLIAADLNGDGIQDLAMSAEGEGCVWLGNGDGTFRNPIPFAAGTSEITSMAVGDFNGDGKTDLALARRAAGSITLMLGNGDGTFGTGSNLEVSIPSSDPGQAPLGPNVLIAADFNGDGTLDLVTTFANYQDLAEGGIAILLGNGDGTFETPTLISAPAFSLAVADLNGDKIPDLIAGLSGRAAGAAPGIAVLIGNGDGSFQPSVQILTSPPPAPDGSAGMIDIAVADFNHDGAPDVAFGLSSIGVAAFLNLAQPPPPLVVVSAASFAPGPLAPNSIATAFGGDLATMTATPAPAATTPTTLGGTTVQVEDSAGVSRPAGLFFASPLQVNFLVPAGAAAGPATVTITSGDGHTVSTQVTVANLAPSLFTVDSSGIAAAYVVRVSPDGAQSIEPVFMGEAGSISAAPVDLASPGQVYLILFGTGFDAATAASTVVRANGVTATVYYAGPQSVFPGLDQINVLLPESLAGSGVTSVVAEVNGMAENTVYVTVR
jgi:uncharacterized protein (TIGR03437 family)